MPKTRRPKAKRFTLEVLEQDCFTLLGALKLTQEWIMKTARPTERAAAAMEAADYLALSERLLDQLAPQGFGKAPPSTPGDPRRAGNGASVAAGLLEVAQVLVGTPPGETLWVAITEDGGHCVGWDRKPVSEDSLHGAVVIAILVPRNGFELDEAIRAVQSALADRTAAKSSTQT